MKKVINLSNDTEIYYANRVPDLYAVCASYCYDNNLTSWWNALVTNNMVHTNAISSLPIFEGEKTIACGDFTIIKQK